MYKRSFGRFNTVEVALVCSKFVLDTVWQLVWLCISVQFILYAICRSPLFGSMLEDVLSSTLSNVMEEAMNGEVLLHVRPRVVALPPSRTSSVSSKYDVCA